jgi:hypothetical protein
MSDLPANGLSTTDESETDLMEEALELLEERDEGNTGAA